MKLDLSIIKTLCQKKGITMGEFADKMGLPLSSLSRTIKNNKTTSDFLEKVSDFFGVSVDTFFGGEIVSSTPILQKCFKNFAVWFNNFVNNYFGGHPDYKGMSKETFINDYFNAELYKKLNDKEIIEYNEVKNIIINYWKLNKEDFVFLKKSNVITEEQAVKLIFWAKANYDAEKFLNNYNIYKIGQDAKEDLKEL